MDGALSSAGDQAMGIISINAAELHGPPAARTKILQENLQTPKDRSDRVYCILCNKVVHRTSRGRHKAKHSKEFRLEHDPQGLSRLQAEVTRLFGTSPFLPIAIAKT